MRILITFDAVCVREVFQSEMAALLALSDRNAHSGLGLVWPLEARSHADANSLKVGASPLLQNSLARILAMAPLMNRPPVRSLRTVIKARFVFWYCP